MHVDPALLAHVAETSGLGAAEARRLVEDVLAFHDEPVEAWVRRRHAEMRLRGLRNDEIFAALSAELPGRLVAAPVLSERQLRRLVYG